MTAEIINEIMTAKDGDREFILSFDGQDWFAAIGNKSKCVCIGEQLSYGEDGVDFYATGATASEALSALRFALAGSSGPTIPGPDAEFNMASQ